MAPGKHALAYSDTVSGLACDLFYIFVEERLVRAKYVVTAEHANRTDYISDYEVLRTALTAKYGKPSSDRTLWKDDLYRDEPSEWGMAVAVGHLVRFADWETTRTDISLLLSGDNYSVNLAVEYRSKELAPMEKDADAKVEANKL